MSICTIFLEYHTILKAGTLSIPSTSISSTFCCFHTALRRLDVAWQIVLVREKVFPVSRGSEDLIEYWTADSRLSDNKEIIFCDPLRFLRELTILSHRTSRWCLHLRMVLIADDHNLLAFFLCSPYQISWILATKGHVASTSRATPLLCDLIKILFLLHGNGRWPWSRPLLPEGFGSLNSFSRQLRSPAYYESANRRIDAPPDTDPPLFPLFQWLLSHQTKPGMISPYDFFHRFVLIPPNIFKGRLASIFRSS